MILWLRYTSIVSCYLCLGLPSGLFQTKNLYAFLSHICPMTHQSNHPSFDLNNNIWWGVPIVNLLVSSKVCIIFCTSLVTEKCNKLWFEWLVNGIPQLPSNILFSFLFLFHVWVSVTVLPIRQQKGMVMLKVQYAKNYIKI